MYTWLKADTEFNKARDPIAGKPLTGRETRLHQYPLYAEEAEKDDAVGYKHKYAVRYHGTDVVTIYPHHYVLNSDGYRTMTTKARMIEYSSVRMFQEKGTWFVVEPSGDNQYWWEGKRYLFFDGIEIDESGMILNKRPDDGTELEIKKKLDNLISKYKAGFKKLILNGELKDPGAGDCFYCSMFDRDGLGSPRHVISHLMESYYVPSLLWNATKERNYMQPGFIWQLMKDSKSDWTSGKILTHYFKKRKQIMIEYVLEYGWPENE